jgi:hypothetical protein
MLTFVKSTNVYFECSSLKIPVGYFFVNGLDHKKRALLLEQCLLFLKDLYADIASITFEGDPVNFKMVEALGTFHIYF